MAYGKRIHNYFYDHRYRISWTLEVWEEDYTTPSGGADVFKSGGIPTSIRKIGDGTLTRKVIQGTELTFTIQHQPGDDYGFLFTSSNRKFWVKLYRAGIIYWSGFVIPGQSIAGFDPYRLITITATDGLGNLKDDVYIGQDSSGDPLLYEDYDTIISIVAKCLSYTGLTLSINSMVNILPEEYNSAPADTVDPLNLVSARQRRFMNDQFNPTSAHTVLEEILRPLVGVTIKMAYGEWWIIRVPEQFEATAIKYRTFTPDGVYYSNDTKDLVNILTGNDGSPMVVPLGGATIENKLGNKSIEIINDYGLRPSLFSGYNFPELEFDPDDILNPNLMKHYSTAANNGWAVVKTGDKYIMVCTNAAEDEGYFYTNPIIVKEGDAGGPAIAEHLKLVIKGGLYDSPSALGVPVAVIVRATSDSNYWYWNAGIADWVEWGASDPSSAQGASVAFPPIDELDALQDITLHITESIPVDGELSLRFYNKTGQPVIGEVLLTIQLNDEDIDWQIRGNNYQINNDNTLTPQPLRMLFNGGTTSPPNLSLFNDGTYILESYADKPDAVAWQHRGDDTGKLLSSLNAQMYIDQDQPAVFRASIVSLLFNFYDVLKIPEYDNRYFIPDDVVFDIFNGRLTGTFIEVRDTTTVFSLTRVPVNPIPAVAIQTGGDNRVYYTTGGSGSGGTPVASNDRRSAVDVAVTTGDNTVAFSSPFPIDISYTLRIFIITDSGGYIGYGTISNKVVASFDINVDENCTLEYDAMKVL